MNRMADRWMAFLGLLFIVAILLFRKEVVGTVRDYLDKRKQ